MSLLPSKGSLELVLTNVTGLLEWYGQRVWPITFQALPSLSKCSWVCAGYYLHFKTEKEATVASFFNGGQLTMPGNHNQQIQLQMHWQISDSDLFPHEEGLNLI